MWEYSGAARSEEGARMEKDKRKAGQKKEERQSNKMSRDQTQ